MNLGYPDECDQAQVIICDSPTGLFEETYTYLSLIIRILQSLTIDYDHVCSRSIQTPR